MKNNQSLTRHINQSFYAVVLTLLFIAASIDAFAAPGDLDPSWGNGGIAVASFSDAIDYTTSTVKQPDGKVLVGGYTYTFVNGSQRFLSSFRARYNGDGTLDATFGTGGKIIDAAGSGEYFGWGLALQPDGKIVAVGTKGVIYSRVNSQIAVVRYNADGTLDTSFGEGGKVFKLLSDYGDHANDVVVQPNGKIVVGGFSGLGATATKAVVLRFNTDGTLDESFAWYGVFSTDFGGGGFNQAWQAALQPDGKLIFACDAYNGADSDFGVIRLNANGTLDTGFGANGKVMTSIASESVWGMALQPDKKILVSGENYDANFNLVSTSIVRYDGDGTLDTGFGANGIVTTPTSSTYALGYGLAVQPNGKIVTAGNKFYDSPNRFVSAERRRNGAKVPAQMRENPEVSRPAIALARYNADGSADATFGADGKIFTPANTVSGGTSVRALPNGKILVSGLSGSPGTNFDSTTVRYQGDPAVQRAAPRDFYGTGRSNFYQSTVSNGLRYFSILKNPVTSPEERRVVQWGLPEDRPMNGDFDGDAKTDVAVWREGASTEAQNFFYVQPSGGASQLVAIPWGRRGDIAGIGYFDDDAKSDVLAIRRENGRLVWYIQLSGGGSRAIAFGIDTDTVSSLGYGFQDFSGDGTADLVVQRIDPDNGNVTFYAGDGRNGNLILAQQWGSVSVADAVGFNLADFTGDGRADIVAFYGPCSSNPTCEIGGTWWIKETGNSNYQVVRFGIPFNNQTGEGDSLTSLADYDGDGKFDITVFRRSNSTFYVRRSSDGGTIAQPFNFFPQ